MRGHEIWPLRIHKVAAGDTCSREELEESRVTSTSGLITLIPVNRLSPTPILRGPSCRCRPIETCLHTNSPRKRPAAWLGNSGRSVNFRATTIPRRFDERRISDGRISSSCLRLMIFEQIWNWSGGINASWLRKLGILLGLVVWINYSNANDIIYIYKCVQILDRDAETVT